MAITITDRPRTFYYNDGGSPPSNVYSNWNAVWNPIIYTFAVLDADILSSLLIEIYEVGSNTLLASNTVRPFKAGSWNVDIAPYIRGYLFSEYSADFASFNNCPDAGNHLNFYIQYTQKFDNGSAPLFNSEQARPITAMCSAMQFGDTSGGNMEHYVPFNFDLPEEQKMKFLTGFETPVMWKDWPFSMSFVYSLNMMGVEIIKREVQQNGNGSALQTDNTNLDPTAIGKVNYLKINNPSQANAKSVLVSLRTGDPVSNFYVDEGYVDDGYTQII